MTASALLGLTTLIVLALSLLSLAVDDLSARQASSAQGRVELTGRVTDADQGPLANVTVTRDGGNETATTNGDGRWNLSMPAGERTLRFEKDGYETVVYHAYALDYPIQLDVPLQMREGTGERREEMISRGTQVGFAVFFGLSALATLAAAIAAGRRTNWVLCLFGAVAGIVGGLVSVVGAVACLVALVLIATSRKSFLS